jgi:hypothetical protein
MYIGAYILRKICKKYWVCTAYPWISLAPPLRARKKGLERPRHRPSAQSDTYQPAHSFPSENSPRLHNVLQVFFLVCRTRIFCNALYISQCPNIMDCSWSCTMW